MRIAMVSTPFLSVPPRSYGGTELIISELVTGLSARGHDVTLFGTGDSDVPGELRALYPTAQWPPRYLADLNHVSWALQAVWQGGFDIVHVHSATGLIYTRFAAAPPVVYTLHHTRDEDLSDFYRYFPDAFYVAISHDQARREIPLEHLTVIHHGLDPARYGLADRPSDYVCFLGRFAPVKGAHTAIDAARLAGVPIRVAGTVHDIDAEYGEREMEPRLRQPHVTALGSVGPEIKVPLLRDARALLAPIEWNEPFGLAMIEAMLSGCPVVAFSHGSVPELIEPGVTGFVARDLEEMADIVRPGGPLDGFDRRRCRAVAVERFGLDRMVESYEQFFERVVAEMRPTGRALVELGGRARADRHHRAGPVETPAA